MPCSSRAAFFLRGPRAFGCCFDFPVVSSVVVFFAPAFFVWLLADRRDFAVPGHLADVAAAARGDRLLSVTVMG